MKLLVFSQHFWPETFLVTDVVRSLRMRGVELMVLTGQPNYPEGQTYAGYNAWAARHTVHDGTSVYRVPLIPRGRGGSLRLVLNYLSFIVSACTAGAWMLRRQRIDVVFVYATSPILQTIAALWIAWMKGARVVTWVQDLWPDSLQATGHVRQPRLLACVASVVRWIYRHNALLLVPSHAFIAPVQAMAGATPVLYHPNPGVGHGAVQASDTPSALKLAPGFNLVFAGNLGTVQALDTVLDAAERLREHADIHWVLVGSGSRSAWLAEEVGRRKLHMVKLLGRFEPAAMPALYAQASALLVSLVRSPIMSQTVPSKVQAYLAAGRPVIAALDGEGARVIDDACAGVTCPAENAAALANAVLHLRAMSDIQREELGLNARRYFANHFDAERLAERLAHLLTSVCSSAHGQVNNPPQDLKP